MPNDSSSATVKPGSTVYALLPGSTVYHLVEVLTIRANELDVLRHPSWVGDDHPTIGGWTISADKIYRRS